MLQQVIISHLNERGQVAGSTFSNRSSDPSGSAWLHDGQQTIRLGLVDAWHTSHFGHQLSAVKHLTQSGKVVGRSIRYGIETPEQWNTESGDSVWVYDGMQTVRVGLTDGEHARQPDDLQDSQIRFVNERGQVAGTSTRFTSIPEADGFHVNGYSAWRLNTCMHLASHRPTPRLFFQFRKQTLSCAIPQA